jgi:Protein kinase domain
MGVVYRARQLRLNREVALKLVLAGAHASPAVRQRFLREAESGAALSHAGVVHVYEVGEHAGLPFIALELCPGGTLADKLAGTPLPPNDAAALAERLARAVHTAHERGVIHRDLKPANVLLSADGTPKIADFGLAKLIDSTSGITATGSVFGTPSYMAPEQAHGDPTAVGPSADVYALGAVLYECLTGRPPFKGATAAETIHQVIYQQPVPVRALNSAVLIDLETVCMKCLEKEPARRYGSAAMLGDDLARFLSGRPVMARPVGPANRAWRWTRRNPVLAGAVATVTLSLLTGAAVSYSHYRAADKARAQAVGEATAKDEALARLSAETQAKDDALKQLIAEKAATEDAYLDGLIRPLRSSTTSGSETLRAEEVEVLSALAAAPSERLRLRFVERAFGSPTGCAKIAALRSEVVWAIVGLDREAAVRLRAVVRAHLQKSSPDSHVSLACAFLTEVLPAGDPDLDHRAAQVLYTRLPVERDTGTKANLVVAIYTLARRLSPPDSLAFSRTVVDRLGIETDRTPLLNCVGTLAILAEQLRPAEVAPLARSIVQRLTVERDSFARHYLADSVAAMSRMLSRAEAAVLVRLVAERAKSEQNAFALGAMARAVAALAKRIEAADAAMLCHPLARALAERAAAPRAANDVSYLAEGLADVAGHLNPAEATTVCGPLVRSLITEIVGAEPTSGPGLKTGRLEALAKRMGPEEASHWARIVAGQMETEKNAHTLANLAEALSALTGPLDRKTATAVSAPQVGNLTSRIAADRSAKSLQGLAHAAAYLAVALSPSEAGPLARTLVDRLPSVTDFATRLEVVKAVAALAERLDPPDAAQICGPLVKTLSARSLAEQRPLEADSLAESVGRLAVHLRPNEASVVCAPLAEAVAKRTAAARDRSDSWYSAQATSHLAKSMADSDLVALLRSYGLFREIHGAVTAELLSRFDTSAELALAASPAATRALRPQKLASFWEFAAWAEAHRPDLDLKSRPSLPVPK